jgi:hypothetical protein
MCEKSMDLIGKDFKEVRKRSPKGLLREEMQQEIESSKSVEWR